MSHIIVYRIVKSKWAQIGSRAGGAFDGEGAKRYGGRWNSKGQPCVYTASSESLATLEMLVHLEDDSILNHYVLVKATIDEAHILELDSLPSNWREEPAPRETAVIGDQWLTSNSSLALRVPSAVVAREFNYLINPNHPNLEEMLQTLEVLQLDIDNRLI